jgi:hypothetical protein
VINNNFSFLGDIGEKRLLLKTLTYVTLLEKMGIDYGCTLPVTVNIRVSESQMNDSPTTVQTTNLVLAICLVTRGSCRIEFFLNTLEELWQPTDAYDVQLNICMNHPSVMVARNTVTKAAPTNPKVIHHICLDDDMLFVMD